MSSKKEVSYDEIIPKKLCSPPPKPPRRRHSDQSSAFSCAPCAFNNNNKQLNGNTYHTVVTANTDVSGSESLPSNWVSEASAVKKLKDTHFFKHLDDNSFQKSFFSVLSIENNVNTNLPLLTSNKFHDSSCSKPNIISHLNDNKLHFCNYFLRKECHFSHNLETKIPCLCTKTHLPKNFDDNELCHKRHHSDPLISDSFRTISPVPNEHLLFENLPRSIKDSKLNALKKTDDLCSNEIKIQKEINDKLWQHLCSLQAKLDQQQQSQTFLENDSIKHPSFSELMVDIYKAQKEKDTVIENRLKSALELRDTAVRELEEVLQILVKSFENGDSYNDSKNNNKELENFFQDLETVEHPVHILQKQHILLAYLYQIKESKIQQLSLAVKLAEEERDRALVEVKALEKEILNLRKSSHVINSNDGTAFEIVSQSDLEFAKSIQAESFCQCLESTSSNIKSTNLGTHFCNNYKTEVFTDNKDISWIDNIDDMELLKTELKNLTQLFNHEVQKRQNAEGNCSRLRRTLNFLLEKFNGLNIGVPV